MFGKVQHKHALQPRPSMSLMCVGAMPWNACTTRPVVVHLFQVLDLFLKCSNLAEMALDDCKLRFLAVAELAIGCLNAMLACQLFQAQSFLIAICLRQQQLLTCGCQLILDCLLQSLSSRVYAALKTQQGPSDSNLIRS